MLLRKVLSGASDTTWQRWWRQGHETGALTAELKLSLSGMMQLLVGVELKGTSTPCSSSMRTPTLWNKLQVQTKPREEEQVQLSRDSIHRGTWSTCGSAPKPKGSRLWEIKHHALIYPLLAGYQPSPGAATHLFHLVEKGVGPSFQWQIIYRKASILMSHMKATETCVLYTAKKILMEIMKNLEFYVSCRLVPITSWLSQLKLAIQTVPKLMRIFFFCKQGETNYKCLKSLSTFWPQMPKGTRSAPTVWNALPQSTRVESSEAIFTKHKKKTVLARLSAVSSTAYWPSLWMPTLSTVFHTDGISYV